MKLVEIKKQYDFTYLFILGRDFGGWGWIRIDPPDLAIKTGYRFYQKAIIIRLYRLNKEPIVIFKRYSQVKIKNALGI
jgi:hypothetical protein